MRRKLLISAAVLGIAILVVLYMTRQNTAAPSYRFVTVEKGDIESVVSSTGSLEAVKTVEVGTQVSGIVSQIFADFNDTVTQGQLIAVLDTTLLHIAVKEAQANLADSQARLRYTDRELERNRGLFDRKMVSDVDLNTAQYNWETAQAAAKGATAKLEAAKQNLVYAKIYAPLSGTVIERDVDVGQTVAASLSSPRLFLIAEDLSRLQILASVDEADIGKVHQGQSVRFTVQAYPDETFTGTVREVRLQSTVQENVVTYTVVVDVANPDGRLLPGMTTTVEFLVEKESGVWKVPNAALRFQPTTAMIEELRRRYEKQAGAAQGPEGEASSAGALAHADGGQGGPAGPGGSARPGGSAGPGAQAARGGWGRARGGTRLFYLDEAGNLAVLPVRLGITDGQYTAISGRDLQEGMQVIAGVQTEPTSSGANAFQSQQRGGRRFPGPGF